MRSPFHGGAESSAAGLVDGSKRHRDKAGRSRSVMRGRCIAWRSQSSGKDHRQLQRVRMGTGYTGRLLLGGMVEEMVIRNGRVTGYGRSGTGMGLWTEE